MKATFDYKKDVVISGADSIVIRKYIAGIPGGRTLDCSDFPDDNILAGHVAIKKADGTYAPMPVTAAVPVQPAKGDTPEVAAQPAKYGSLPSGASYVGVIYRSVSKDNPSAAIMYSGVVNPTLLPYPMTDILAAFKAACPHIIFEQDEEA